MCARPRARLGSCLADAGFAGVAIVLGRDFRTLRFDDDRFIVGAGASLSAVVQEAFKRAIGGFEFAVGTPGTIGGSNWRWRCEADALTPKLARHIRTVCERYGRA